MEICHGFICKILIKYFQLDLYCYIKVIIDIM